MKKVLNKGFFDRDSYEVAEDLLGKCLVCKRGVVKITEIEIYDGFKDRGSHASRGETERNKVMFGEAGYFYVYLVYGMHNMLNIVTREKGYPAAILIRGGISSDGKITGPGVLTKYLGVDKKYNGLEAKKENGLWFEDREESRKEIKKLSRVGIDYAGPYWRRRKLRFILK